MLAVLWVRLWLNGTGGVSAGVMCYCSPRFFLMHSQEGDQPGSPPRRGRSPSPRGGRARSGSPRGGRAGGRSRSPPRRRTPSPRYVRRLALVWRFLRRWQRALSLPGLVPRAAHCTLDFILIHMLPSINATTRLSALLVVFCEPHQLTRICEDVAAAHATFANCEKPTSFYAKRRRGTIT